MDMYVKKTYSKANQGFYFLRQMNMFGVSKDFMELCCNSVIQSVITNFYYKMGRRIPAI